MPNEIKGKRKIIRCRMYWCRKCRVKKYHFEIRPKQWNKPFFFGCVVFACVVKRTSIEIANGREWVSERASI